MDINEISKKTWEITKSHKRYVLAVVLLLVFVIRGCSSSTTTTTVATETYTVVSGSIENNLKVLGTTKITNLQTLVFGTEGKVTHIYVKEGDKVKAGDLLAELDKEQLSISLSQQSLGIQNAKINYDKLLNQYTDADKLKAQSDVATMQSKLEIAKKELIDLQSARGTTVQITSPKIQNIIISTKNYINSSKKILSDIDEVFYITKSDTLYKDVQINISAKNSSSIASIESSFYQNTDKLNQLSTKLSNIAGQTKTEMTAIQDLQNSTKEFLNSFSILVGLASNAAQNTITSNSLSQLDINGRVSKFTSDSSTVLSLLSSVNTNIQDLQNTANDIPTKQNEINSDIAQLQMLQQTLQDMENGPNSNDRTLQSNSIKQSQLSLAQTSQQKDNYEIVAPFDGTIDAIGFKVGDTVSSNAGTSANGITMSNPDIYEVSMLIDQIDIVKIDKGQMVEISFDAYPGYTATGAISTIDPTPVTSAGVVSYYANIAMKKGEKKIYDGMSVTVNIIIESKTGVLIVPTTAIQTIKGVTAIPVIEGGAIVPKTVVVGITDGINSEIISGLSLGNVVSLTTYTSSATTTSASTGSTQSDTRSSMNSMRALEGGSSGGPSGFPGN